jgi:hypothetical protein
MASTPRDKIVTFRVDDDEYVKLNQLAKRADMSIGEYIRNRTLAETPVAYVTKAKIEQQLTGLKNAITRAQQELSGNTKKGV